MIRVRKMFCRSCGKELAPDARFCDRCGAQVVAEASPPYGASSPPPYQAPPSYGPPPYPGYNMYPEKEPVLALILSAIVPGVGQIYCEKVARGAMILLALIAFNVVAMIAFMGIAMSSMMWGGLWIGSILVWVVSAVIWIWQIIDAYQLANQWNDIARTGRRPW